jgi:hypothetical protein
MFARSLPLRKRNKYYIFQVRDSSPSYLLDKAMGHFILSSVAWLDLQNISTLSNKIHCFQEIIIKSRKCVPIFSTYFLKHSFIIRRIQRDIIISAHTSLCKVPSLLHLIKNWIFSTDFQKILSIKFHENPSRGSRIIFGERTDRRTWRSL